MMNAKKAQNITAKAKPKTPMFRRSKIIDIIKLIIIYFRVLCVARKGENVIFVRKISPALKNKLEIF